MTTDDSIDTSIQDANVSLREPLHFAWCLTTEMGHKEILKSEDKKEVLIYLVWGNISLFI